MGRPIALIDVTECHKRDYPHCHLLTAFIDEDRISNPEELDSSVSSKVPNQNTFSLLCESVTIYMMHEPFVNDNPDCTCMKNENCT